MEEKIRNIIAWHCGGDYEDRQEATKEILALFDVRLSLPSHIDAGKEAKKYANEMNGEGKPNGFHELDFYNGTIWLRDKIEGNEA